MRYTVAARGLVTAAGVLSCLLSQSALGAAPRGAPANVPPPSAAANPQNAAAAQIAEKPAVKPGDRWVYQRRDLMADKVIEKSEFVVAAIAGDTVDMRRTPLALAGAAPAGKLTTERHDWARGIRSSAVESGDYRYFEFPLQTGKQWSYKYRRPSSGGGPSTDFDAKVEVKGWRDVSVPAGSFRALLIRHSGGFASTAGGAPGTYQMDVWYAPQAHRFVKEEFEGYAEGSLRVKFRTELVEYQLAP